MPLGGTEGAAQTDLGPALEHRYDHDVGDADSADEQRHGAEPEEQRVEGALGLGPCDECVGGTADGDFARYGGVGGGGEDRSDGGDLSVSART